MYTLYHHPYSQHSRRVVSLLVEGGLDYELRRVDFDKNEHMSPAYLTINPNHQVPTLIDGDIKIHESNAILRYLCAKHGLNDWYPKDLGTRAAVEQWLDWNQCRLARNVIDIVLNKVFLGDRGDRAAIERAEKNMPELAAILDAGVAKKPYFAGIKPTIADLSLASSVFQLTLADAMPEGRNIADWYRRMGEIGGFRNSLPPV